MNKQGEKSSMENSLAEIVATLCHDDDGRHADAPGSLENARALIEKSFVGSGARVKTLPYLAMGVERRNFVAHIGPRDGPRIVVGAHYDTVPGSPGADDNASAVAVMLMLAKLLGKDPPPFGLDFMAFDTEEPPCYGGPHMGSALLASQSRKKVHDIRLMICLEMVGYFSKAPWKDAALRHFPEPSSGLEMKKQYEGFPDTGSFIAIIGYSGEGKARELVDHSGKDPGLELFAAEFPERPNPAAYSDSLNFHAAGFPTVMVTDTAFVRNTNYHEAGDTIDTLDYSRMAVLTVMLERGIRRMASPSSS